MKTLPDYTKFAETADVLQLKSYWFKGFRKPLVQSQNGFRSRQCLHIRVSKSSLKMYEEISEKFTNTSGFRKPWDCN
jgi:hypothetical protein